MDYMWERKDFSKDSKIKDSLLEKLLNQKSDEDEAKEETDGGQEMDSRKVNSEE